MVAPGAVVLADRLGCARIVDRAAAIAASVRLSGSGWGGGRYSGTARSAPDRARGVRRAAIPAPSVSTKAAIGLGCGATRVVDGVRALLAALAAAALAAGCAASVPSSNAAQPDPGLPARLVAATTGDGAYRHLEELQRIADTHGGNRAAGRPGFDASADYVAGVLRAAGFDVSVPEVVVRSYTAGNERLAVGGTLVAARALALSPPRLTGSAGHSSSSTRTRPPAARRPTTPTVRGVPWC